jgi:hypothetical protein
MVAPQFYSVESSWDNFGITFLIFVIINRAQIQSVCFNFGFSIIQTAFLSQLACSSEKCTSKLCTEEQQLWKFVAEVAAPQTRPLSLVPSSDLANVFVQLVFSYAQNKSAQTAQRQNLILNRPVSS